ncbi:MAG: hypothetical protein QJR06_10810 [Alicyclobacillaceae bacterium]|nr:hypothetical protein [Alicyclobacillaceae bacterium]
MALQANPEVLRRAATFFPAAGAAVQGRIDALHSRIVAEIQENPDGWVGEGAKAFLARLEAEVGRFQYAADVLHRVGPIFTYLASEMEEILALRRQADELEREAQHAKGPEAAWLWARAQALRLEADARADWADVKAAAEFAAISLEKMVTDFWNSPQMGFVRHTVETAVNTATAIGTDVVEHPIDFTWGFLSSTAEAMSWGLYDAPEPTDPDAAYYAGRVLGDTLAAAGGGAIAGAGLTAEGGGFVLDATGVGAVAGVPLNVAGAAVAVAGAGVVVKATADLGKDTQMMMAKGEQGRGVRNDKGSPEGTGGLSATERSVQSKLEQYLLNPDHPIGGSKANWFQKALGFNRDNMDELAKQIKFNPNTAVETGVTQYGIKYNQVINILGANGRRIDVTFAWIRNNDGVVRLVTAIPTGK